MAGAFESVTKVAIEEIIQSHAKESKFGLILTNEGYKELTEDLYRLLLNSRSLKAAGDKMLQMGPTDPGKGKDRKTIR